MADTGMSAIKQPLDSRELEWLHNMRTWRTSVPVLLVLVLLGGQVGMLTTMKGVSSHFPAMPVVTGFPARIHG
jgi:hypothetical protein